ncbi:hypothetical protein U771_11145 [Pseudomonas gorinensis]|uniref:Uncharacterized protein n=1 Tax=Pseudomonas gorinensis TaxID=3240790 RepID=A0ACA7P4B4_9PSED|nr:hypothetical protein U771_11145 [Pseudomonas sp. TKP]
MAKGIPATKLNIVNNAKLEQYWTKRKSKNGLHRVIKMKNKPNMSIIRGLLFTYDIENTDDLKRENLISSKNINTEKELIELIDELTKPEFLSYTKQEQEWFIDSIEHYLSIGDNFDSIFKTMATYFSEPVINQQMFMRTLLGRLRQYRNTQ